MNKQAIWAVAKKDMLAIKESIQIWLPILIFTDRFLSSFAQLA